jgi:hypothetical protein
MPFQATVDLLANTRQQGQQLEILAKPIKPEELISLIRDSAVTFRERVFLQPNSPPGTLPTEESGDLSNVMWPLSGECYKRSI